MAELARWQWDDIGVWRDFAEQYQAEMEAAFQRRDRSLVLEIPPFGTFEMNISSMMQVTREGRNPGYERPIRRQARKVELNYFLKGCDGELFASDCAVDQIEDQPVLETLVKVLGRILEEPDEFGHRSIALSEDEYLETLGQCKPSVEFLSERGFEVINEGNALFCVFMQDDVSGLAEGKTEVEARLARLRRRSQKSLPSNAVADAVDNKGVVETSSASAEAIPAEAKLQRDEVTSSGLELCLPSGATTQVSLEGASLSSLLETAKKAAGLRLPLLQIKVAKPLADKVSKPVHESPAPVFANGNSQSSRGRGRGRGRGKGKDRGNVERPASAAPQEMAAVPQTSDEAWRPLASGCEPGLELRATGLKPGCQVEVTDFEPIFVQRLQNGLLRLQDLALVGPLLDWERPELLKLLLGRLRAFLEEGCDAWCKAAECEPDQEMMCGRALLRLVYGAHPLDRRLEVCRSLLSDKGQPTKLQIDRQAFLSSALGGLNGLSIEQLRRPLSVCFVGEAAEDHGGPRRDFFGLLGSRLTEETPSLWRRLSRGVLAPTPDLVAESATIEARAGLQVDAAYRACGRACGLAARYGDVIGQELAGFFLHQVARDDTIGLAELQQQLSESEGHSDVRASGDLLVKKLEDVGLIGLTLSRVITGTLDEIDLVPGGRNVPVTDDNKAEWLQLHLHNKLYGSLKKAADAFRSGIIDVFGGTQQTCALLVLVSPAELAKIWAGSAVSNDDIRLWREVATVSGEVKQQGDWLWELLEAGDQDFRGSVLKFATGVHRLGHAGALTIFEVQPADGGDDSLPRAMTCANMLQVPRYSSKEILRERLQKAIEMCDGFQIL